MTDNQLTLLLLVPVILGFAGFFLKNRAIGPITFALVAVGAIGSGAFLFLSQ